MPWEEHSSSEPHGCEGDVYSMTGLFRVVGFGTALSGASCMDSRVTTMIWKQSHFL